MPDTGLLIPTANRAPYKQGSQNNFGGIYKYQCTWWASQRYHDLTGIWVPWLGNADQWAYGAQQAGWVVASMPPRGVPSIICLQPTSGYGLAGTVGHVAVVESINSNGTVHTSNFNWPPHMGDGVVVYLDGFRPGLGVSFLYASDSATGQGQGLLSSLQNGTLSSFIAGAAKSVSLAPNADVTQFLFLMDDALQFVNPFTPPDVQQDTIVGVTFNDPVDYLEKVAGALWQDGIAITWRMIFLFLGFFLLYKVLSHFVDFAGIASQTGGAVAKILPLMA